MSEPTLRGPRQRRQVIAEAKEALGALHAAEQVYYQKPQNLTFVDVADAADARLKLGVDLERASRRWAFSVSGASVTGFVAKAQGRNDTRAEGFIVTLIVVRGQPPEWRVRRHRYSFSTPE